MQSVFSIAGYGTPGRPELLTISTKASSQITLKWQLPSEGSNPRLYHIYRCEGYLCEPQEEIGQTQGLMYVDSGLKSATTYVYSVSAEDEEGAEGSKSDWVMGATYEDGFIPAFPGAEGFGAETVGGRGGKVVHVTNLNDSGPGSFREAVETYGKNYPNGSWHSETDEEYKARIESDGHRIVVFDVSGIINLESELLINRAYLTIAGETSPGGILIAGAQTTINTHDVIIRGLRFRCGSHRISDGADPETLDSFDILGKYWRATDVYNIIIDHCSFSWGVDETFSISGGVEKATVQWCIISEGLSHAGHPKGEHSKGLLISGKYVYPSSVSLHHCYIAHNTDRNPQVYAPAGVSLIADIVNNVVYDWHGGQSLNNSGEARCNFIHNYAKQGIESNSYSREVTYSNLVTPPTAKLYVLGNIGSTRLLQTLPQWNVGVEWRDQDLDEGYRSFVRFDAPLTTVNYMSLDMAKYILSKVGAIVPNSDSVDKRVINDFLLDTGHIVDNVVFPDSYPEFADIQAPCDTDNDGMPDVWERKKGINRNSDDSAQYDLNSFYTNIEVYLNELAQGMWQDLLHSDVNRNGSVNIDDVQLVVNVILGNAIDNCADVNGDGSVTISDAQAVVNGILN